jgi:hypothetical protein
MVLLLAAAAVALTCELVRMRQTLLRVEGALAWSR